MMKRSTGDGFAVCDSAAQIPESSVETPPEAPEPPRPNFPPVPAPPPLPVAPALLPSESPPESLPQAAKNAVMQIAAHPAIAREIMLAEPICSQGRCRCGLGCPV